MVKEYIEYFVKKKNQFYIVQLVFLIILFLFVMKNGLTAGWNTWVLQGPYNYPHTLAYLFLFMMMLDTFYFIEFREKFVILFIAVSFACIILTAVRSVLIASIIVIGYIFYRVFSRKQFIKFILYCFLLFVCIYIAYNYGLFDALLTKSKLALENGSISNGRSSILISSLYALKQGNEYVNTICGVGMTNLLKWNGININANIQNRNLLLQCVPSNNYRYPTSGVGLIKYLHANLSHSGLAEKLQTEFKDDKVEIINAAFNSYSGDLELDLDFSEADAGV